MKHYVTIQGPYFKPRKYLRAGFPMYTKTLREAMVFNTLEEAQSRAEDLRRLLALMPSRKYMVGTMSKT